MSRSLFFNCERIDGSLSEQKQIFSVEVPKDVRKSEYEYQTRSWISFVSSRITHSPENKDKFENKDKDKGMMYVFYTYIISISSGRVMKR